MDLSVLQIPATSLYILCIYALVPELLWCIFQPIRKELGQFFFFNLLCLFFLYLVLTNIALSVHRVLTVSSCDLSTVMREKRGVLVTFDLSTQWGCLFLLCHTKLIMWFGCVGVFIHSTAKGVNLFLYLSIHQLGLGQVQVAEAETESHLSSN